MNVDSLPAGEDTDALVAEHVMEWTIRQGSTSYDGNVLHYRVYVQADGTTMNPIPFSTDIAAAWRVVEKMRQYIGVEGDDRWDDFVEELNIAHDYKISSLLADLTPRAICRAAITASLRRKAQTAR